MEATAQLILAGHHVGYLPNDLAKRYEEMRLMKILLPNEASYEVKHHWAYRENLHKQVAEFLSQMTRLLWIMAANSYIATLLLIALDALNQSF